MSHLLKDSSSRTSIPLSHPLGAPICPERESTLLGDLITAVAGVWQEQKFTGLFPKRGAVALTLSYIMCREGFSGCQVPQVTSLSSSVIAWDSGGDVA